jgi:hypothetical protein
MLLDDIVHASLRSLALGPPLFFLLSLLLPFARSFSVGGSQTGASTGALSLAWW